MLSECEMINQGLLKAADVFRFIEFSSRGTVLESGITAADLAIFAHLAEDEAVRDFGFFEKCVLYLEPLKKIFSPPVFPHVFVITSLTGCEIAWKN